MKTIQNSSGSTFIDLPGRKLATSNEPRMLTPSEIELLRQDLEAALKFLRQDKIDDAPTSGADRRSPGGD
jgi:hypothetical protein